MNVSFGQSFFLFIHLIINSLRLNLNESLLFVIKLNTLKTIEKLYNYAINMNIYSQIPDVSVPNQIRAKHEASTDMIRIPILYKYSLLQKHSKSKNS